MYYFIDFIDNDYIGDLYQSSSSGDTYIGYVDVRKKQVSILVECISMVDLDTIGERVSRLLQSEAKYNVITIYDF